MAQCPSCNVELTQKQVETDLCPVCGKSLLLAETTMDRDADKNGTDESVEATETVNEDSLPNGCTVMIEENTGDTFSLRDFSQKDLEIFRQAIAEQDDSVIADQERNEQEFATQRDNEKEGMSEFEDAAIVETMVEQPAAADLDDIKNVKTVDELPTDSGFEETRGSETIAEMTPEEQQGVTTIDESALEDELESRMATINGSVTEALPNDEVGLEQTLASDGSSESHELPTVLSGDDELETTDGAAGTEVSRHINSATGKAESDRKSTQIIDETNLVIHEREVLHTVNEKPKAKRGADFQLIDLLGEGGMGLVYKATQGSVNSEVAVKMIRQKIATNPRQRGNFLTEAVVTSDLDHPNIVPIYDLGANKTNTLFYAMKYVQGTSWHDAILKRSLNENLDVLMKVSDAIAFAHSRGVVHRDLKPANILENK